MAAAVEVGTPAVAAPAAPAAKTPPPKPAVEAKPEPAAEEKPKPVATPEAARDAREAKIAKFAKSMNADAEKDGVAVDAPAEERRAKPGPKPGSKREPAKPAAAAAEPPAPKAAPRLVISPEETGSDDTAEAATETADEDADTGKPEPRAAHQLKAKARLRHGDVDKAIKIAFGDLKPEEFEATREALAKRLDPGSKKWAEVRRYEQAERAKSKQLEQNAVQLSQRLQKDFQPLIDARKAYAEKDYPRAFELAFGEDVNDFSRKAIHQKLSVDPEKTRLSQRLEEMANEIKSLKSGAPAQQQATPEQAQAAAMQREGDRTHKALTEQTDDPEIAHFARKTAFVNRVVELRGEHYDPQSRTTISLRDAADMARDELKRAMDDWRYDNASGAAAPSSESPGLAGNEPVRTSGNRARSPLPSQAAQAGGSTRSMTRQERIDAYAARMS